ncbi:MAG: SDR family oxidoreductase [Pseudomonadota bacterium]
MTIRKTCLITGASAGIGAACALRAAKDYDLLLTYRSDQSGAESTAKAARALGAQVHIVQADVAEPDDIAKTYQAFDQHFETLDLLINNAGIVAPVGTLQDMDHARLRRMFDVNVIGTMLMAKGALPRMGAGSTIINMGSAAARLGSGGSFIDYAASKAAIDTFTKGLSDEVAPRGIRVLAIRPGIIVTDIHAKAHAAERVEQITPSIPLRRAGTADEVAALTLWLASDAAGYITGTSIDITGGR